METKTKTISFKTKTNELRPRPRLGIQDHNQDHNFCGNHSIVLFLIYGNIKFLNNKKPVVSTNSGIARYFGIQGK